jgi:hypothetical protein
MHLCLINILIFTEPSIYFEPEGSPSGRRLYVEYRFYIICLYANCISSLAGGRQGDCGSGVPRNIFRGGGLHHEFFLGGQCTLLMTGHSEWESGDGSPLVRDSTQFANEWNPYSDYVVTGVYSTELGIRLSFLKTSEFRGGFEHPPPPVRPLDCGRFYFKASAPSEWLLAEVSAWSI